MGDRGSTAALHAVAPPTDPVFRLARHEHDPFAPIPWQFAADDGTFGNRFDDPGQADDLPIELRFRVTYCATQRAAAFGETIAGFLPPLWLLDRVARAENGEVDAARRAGLVDPDDPQHGLVPASWWNARHLGQTLLDPAPRFVDLTAGATIHHLRLALAPVAARLGLPDFDASAVMGSHRRLTQACARYVYEQVDDAGNARYAGLRYASRLNPAWSCWAIFSDRLQHTPGFPETIFPDDPGLLEAAALLGLTIESVDGRFVRPWR